MRLMAIDPSLTCSGWALFNVEEGILRGVGKITSLPPSRGLPERLVALQQDVHQLLNGLNFGPNDYLVCEAPTTMRDPKAVVKVEQVRGIFESLARLKGAQVPGRVNPRTVQHHMFGMRGAQVSRDQVKEHAIEAVRILYADRLEVLNFSTDLSHLRRHQDIVDAILIGHLAQSWIKSALMSGSPEWSFFEEGMKRKRSASKVVGR